MSDEIMIEFNPDGSIKIPGKMAAQKAKQESKMQSTQCMRIRKEVVSIRPPKSCSIHITLSDKITDDRFIDNIYYYFNRNSEVPTRLIKIGPKEFKVEIGTSFRRCQDCTTLISRFREFMHSNVIENDGNCSYRQRRSQNFCYEDYFG